MTIESLLLDRLTHSPSLESIIDAVVAVEDRRFWQHRGYDFVAMIRAAAHYVHRGRVSGASTIEQQLVRTIRKRYEMSLRRKISEILIARAISRRFSKHDVINSYLQIAYFGWHANGLRQASDRFDIDIDHVEPHEAALLASLLKLPMPREPSPAYLARLERRMDHVRKSLQNSRAG